MTLEFEEIYPKIFVYKNPWKDLEKIKNIIINSENDPDTSILGDWKDWYTFGKEVNMLNFENKPDNERTVSEKEAWDEIIDVFYKTTDHYTKHFNVPIEKDAKVYNEMENGDMEVWKRMGPSICKYEVGGGIEDSDLAMHYHTDYQVENVNARGYKFAVTCTMYLNDDYEGGGIDFLVGSKDKSKMFYYKPKAGDVLVFPAGDPHYLSEEGELYHHGVKKVWGSPKYFIRNHWTWFYEGSEEWQEQEKIYGKEIWAEMEFQRKKKERSEGVYQTITVESIQNVERINDVI